jgi:WD40 repeat protein
MTGQSERDGRLDPVDIDTGAEFAAGLTDLRLRAGRSIRDVARATGIPSATLGGYFSGRHLPPGTQPQQFDQLLDALGVTDPAEVSAWREALLRTRRANAGRPIGQRGSDSSGSGLSPYRGLEPFTDRDAALFFGREGIVEDLVAAVEDRAGSPDKPGVLVLVGPSGSGKSSVLRAGLVPSLRDRDDQPWAVSVLVPGTDPMAALATARAEVVGAARVLLVVDQAEEVFSPLVSPEQRSEFIRELVAEAEGRTSPERTVVVVAGLRADFYGQAASDPDLLPALQSSQVLLGSMPLSDLRRAVVRPAESVGVSIEPELVDLLLRDLSPRGQGHGAYEAGALPLVSHALLATWQRHRGNRLTVGDYLAAGGLAGAVQQTAESVVAGLDETGRNAAQWLFGQLVAVDDEGVMTRRRVRHDDLRHPDPGTDLALDDVIEAFVAGRLITAGDTTIEISHEALLWAWPRLRDWMLRDLDAARLQRRIADAAAVWRERDRDPSALLRGGLLADAQDLDARPLTSHRVLTAGEHDFVTESTARAESEATAERRRTRRLRTLLAVMTVLALLAGLLAGVAFRARDEAAQARDEALSRQLAISANDLRDSDPALGAQLALSAYQVSPTVQARSSLLDSTGVPTPTRFVGPSGEMHAVASPDGSVLAISGADGATRLWQRTSGNGSAEGAPGGYGGYEQAGELPAAGGGEPAYASAFSPDGTLLAVGTAAGDVTVWDLRALDSPQKVAALGADGAAVYSLAFRGDGTQLAAGTSEPAVRRWALPADSPGEPRALESITEEFGGKVQSVAYRPDGEILATGSSDGAIRLWSTPTDGPAALLGTANVGPTTNFVHSVAFSPDGNLLVSGEKNRVARLWDVSDPSAPTQQGEPLEGFTSWVNTVAFSPDGTTVAAGSSDGHIQLFTVNDGRSTSTLPTPAVVTSVQFVGPGSALLTSEVDGVARLWPLPGPVHTGFSDTVWNIFPSADGSLVGVSPGTADGSVHLVDSGNPTAVEGTTVLTPPEEAGRADGAAAMSSDGRWVAAGTAIGRVAVWERDLESGEARLAGVVTVSDQLIEAVAITADGSQLAAVADDGAVRLWTLHPGAEPRQSHQLSVPGLPLGAVFSPDSSLLAVGTTDAQVHLWQLPGPAAATGAEAEELPPLTGFANYVYGVTFDPTGRYLAAGSTDRTVRIWDLTNPGEAVPVGSELRGPGDTVYAVSWTGDGAVLAGVSKDGAVWMWDVTDPAAPRLQSTLTAAEGNLYAVALAPAGAHVSAGGTAQGVVTWQIDPDAVAASTCPRTGTPMTQDEWQQVAPGVPYDPPCPLPAGS